MQLKSLEVLSFFLFVSPDLDWHPAGKEGGLLLKKTRLARQGCPHMKMPDYSLCFLSSPDVGSSLKVMLLNQSRTFMFHRFLSENSCKVIKTDKFPLGSIACKRLKGSLYLQFCITMWNISNLHVRESSPKLGLVKNTKLDKQWKNTFLESNWRLDFCLLAVVI